MGKYSHHHFADDLAPTRSPSAPQLTPPLEPQGAGRYLVSLNGSTDLPPDVSEADLHLTSFLFRVLKNTKNIAAYYWLVSSRDVKKPPNIENAYKY